MDPITISFHLALPTGLCLVGLVLIGIYRRRLFSKNKRFWLSATLFLAIYLFIVGGALYEDLYAQWDLNRYDLDQDGFFSGEEHTAEQKDAMFRLTNDVGRNFSFITGFIAALVIAVAVYGIEWLFSGTRKTMSHDLSNE